MKTVVLELPMLMFIVGTRAALGVGIGLLASSRLPDAKRRMVGKTLVTLGAISTIPAALSVMHRVTSTSRT